MRKLFIPFRDRNTIGGPTTFMANLRGYLDRRGFPYTRNPLFASGIFFPVAFNRRVIRLIRFFGGKVIQRLDGIYYPSKHGDGYVLKNQAIKDIYSGLADFVVFQSEYSRKQCFAMLGEKGAGEYGIIVNGANLDIFHPDEKEISAPKKFILATTGNFRNIDMLEPIIKALDELVGEFDFEFWVIGPISNPALEGCLAREYVRHLGPKDKGEVAALLRESDIFIYSHLNPPCPNSVIEAISSGLPVVGFDSGSMSELLSFNKELLAPVSDEVFQRYDDFDHRKLAEKIRLAVGGYERFKKTAMENWRRYDFEECGRKYVEVFERVVR